MLIISFIYVINPLGIQFKTLIRKNLLFKKAAIVENTSELFGFVISIILACYRYGAYSIAFGLLSTTIIKTAILVWIGWRDWCPSFHFRFTDLRRYLRFGLCQAGTVSVTTLFDNVDYIIIGRYLGPGILGSYMYAYRLIVFPLLKVGPIIKSVVFPVFAKKQNDDASLCRGYSEMIKLMAFVFFPLLTGLAVTADILIPFVSGPQWKPAIIIAQILVPLGILKVLTIPFNPLMQAKGKVEIAFKLSVGVAIANTLVFLALVRFGAHAIAFAYVGLTLGQIILMSWILTKTIGFQSKSYYHTLAHPALSTCVMGLVVYGCGLCIHSLTISHGALLFLLVSLGIMIYTALEFYFDRKFLIDLKQIIL